MKQFQLSLAGATALLVIMIGVLSCTKSGQEDCMTGGVTFPNTYRFWTALRVGDIITVEIKTAAGSNSTPVDNKIRVYYNPPSDDWEPNPCTFNRAKEAVANLRMGETYKYKATGGGRQWTGTIHVPCVQDECFNIEIK